MLALVSDRLFFIYIGHREAEFIEFNNEETFWPKAIELAEQAKNIALLYRNCMSSPPLIKKFVLNKTVGNKHNIWSYLNKGMVCLYSADFVGAKEYFQNVLDSSDERDWALSAKDFVRAFIYLEPAEQILFVQDAIQKSRQLKKLPERNVVFGNDSTQLSLPNTHSLSERFVYIGLRMWKALTLKNNI